jgi:hypothetical protein
MADVPDFDQLARRLSPAYRFYEDYTRKWLSEAYRFYTDEVPAEIASLLKKVPTETLKPIAPPQFDTDEDCADVVRALHHVAESVQAHGRIVAESVQTTNAAIYSVTNSLTILTQRIEAARQAIDAGNALKIQTDATRDFKIGLWRQLLEILESGFVGMIQVFAQYVFARTGVRPNLPTVGSKTDADGPELAVTDVKVEEENL